MKISVSFTFRGTRSSIRKSSVFYLEVESCATIDDLKTKIRAQEGLDHEECRQRWSFEGRHLAGGRTLAECEVREGSMLDLVVDRWGELMEIFVLTRAGLRITRMVVSTDTVAYVKSELQDELEAMDPRVDQQQQRLFFNGKELQDDRTLEEYGIGEGLCLHVVLQSLGGSVPLMGATDDEGEAALAQGFLSRHSRPGEMVIGSVLLTEPTCRTLMDDPFSHSPAGTFESQLLEEIRSWQECEWLETDFGLPKPGTTSSFEVESSDTMDIVKAKIQCEIGIFFDQDLLYSFDIDRRAKQVEDDKLRADYNLGRWSYRLRSYIVLSDSNKMSAAEAEVPFLSRGDKFDPDRKAEMLKEKITRMIYSMEQRRRRGGNVYVGSSKTFSSGSLDFRDNYISIVLFDGSYVWIKSRDPAHRKRVHVRRRNDRFGRVYLKYEPRFKPPREKTPSGETLQFNYLSLGEYGTPEEAEEVWKMLASYYGKHDGRLELADGTHFCVPPMRQALSGMEKANWVKAKLKQVREEFRKELEASKDRLIVIPEGSVDVDELMAVFDEAQLEDQLASSSQDRSADVAYQRIELSNTVASGFEFNTNLGNSDEQLNPQVAELLQVNRQLSEQLQQHRDNEQRLLQENEGLKRVMLQVVETLKGCMGSTVGS